ncbi:MAG TPA: MGMT family protein [Candidatus Bathyarchaeia archaeon]|nr:MGMT family protein [Candidatus Bathyarchaeia archaeon]
MKKIIPFSQKVYQLVKKVPPGKVTTYKEIAQALNSKAYQAVGQTLACNPLSNQSSLSSGS